MRKKIIGLAAFITALPFCFFSCIKEELPNVEADIEVMKLPSDEGFVSTSVKPNDWYDVIAYTKTGSQVDLSHIVPEFILSPGATIDPPSSVAQDFTNPVVYKVTSEDGRYSNTYTVRFMESVMPTSYQFQHWDTIIKPGSKYYHPYEVSGDKRIDIWASGNSIYSILGGTTDTYPTRIKIDPATHKKMLYLETRDTGVFGASQKKPNAAGNLFIGDFDATIATKDPMGATHFGRPINQEPKEFYFSYNYKPATYIKDGQEYTDECDIYAVLFEVDSEVKYLKGDNVLTHRNIVAMARIDEPGETPGTAMVKKTIPFNYEFSNRFDPEKLANTQYYFTVVFTSSRRGAEFIGGIGSALTVEEAEVICR